ncbi:hypothetical protein Moror_749 [Moniliophthora roreri MCA 2997]|uniref:Uncharacterized protein n=1 Tax=Moniliophthora roreri (strain MCA 2997) TaxID=1381753 RepID=V2XAW0_MONRO|nr:hypothetical protein Moror_749 [Moniliophthora roreri MCA 2997]
MRPLTYALPLLSALAAIAAPSPNLEARQVQPNQHGTIISPSADSLVSSGGTFDFNYRQSNWCNAGYSPITVWLTDYEPVAANLTTTGVFPEGAYTFFFGSFLEPNFGLPPLSGNPPPPSTLTLPTVDGVVSGGKLYLAVVETANTCPPRNVPPQYALTKTSLVLQ